MNHTVHTLMGGDQEEGDLCACHVPRPGRSWYPRIEGSHEHVKPMKEKEGWVAAVFRLRGGAAGTTENDASALCFMHESSKEK